MAASSLPATQATTVPGLTADLLHERSEYSSSVAVSSAAIRVSRVLCIFFMTYVHVHLLSLSGLEDSSAFIAITTVLRDVLGRSSVPLLSVVSGFLMIGYFGRKPMPQVFACRFVTLIVPLVFWSVIGFGVFTFLGDGVPFSLNELVPFTAAGSQVHLAFLRDIFVLALITPLLIFLLKKGSILALVAMITAALLVDPWPVLLRAQILIYYLLGLFFGLYRMGATANNPVVRATALLSFGTIILWMVLQRTGVVVAPASLSFFDFDTLVLRPICALSFWYVAKWLSQSKTIMSFVSQYLEPAAYLLFLSHYVVARLMSGVYSQLSVLHTSPLYVAVWLLLPVGCLAVAVLGKMVLKRAPPILSVLVSGKG